MILVLFQSVLPRQLLQMEVDVFLFSLQQYSTTALQQQDHSALQPYNARTEQQINQEQYQEQYQVRTIKALSTKNNKDNSTANTTAEQQQANAALFTSNSLARLSPVHIFFGDGVGAIRRRS